MLYWLVISTPLAYLIYALVEPTFEAVSLLRAEPTQMDIYNNSTLRGTPNLSEVKPYLLTQVHLITSDNVLDTALSKPGISNLPMVRSSKDPKADVRAAMKVEIVGANTYLIEVGLASKDANEAAAIVNAVVQAYIDQHNSYHTAANRALKANLENEETKLTKKISEAQDELELLVNKGKVALNKKQDLLPPVKGEDGAEQTSFKTVTEPQYVRATSELWDTEMKLLDAQAALEIGAGQSRPGAGGGRRRRQREDAGGGPAGRGPDPR